MPTERPRLWRLSWAEWRAHPWRQLAALLSVALGVALALAVHLINESALAEFSAAVRSANGEPDLRLLGGASGLPDDSAARLAALAPVRAAHPRIERSLLMLPADGSRPRTVDLLGIDALSVAAVAPGLLPRPNDTQDRLAMLRPGQVFVNPALLKLLGSAGELRLLVSGRAQAFAVAGTVAAGGAPLAVMDVAAAQAALGLDGTLSAVDLRLAPGATAAAVRQAYGPLPAGARWAAADDEAQQVSNLSRAYRVNLTVLALVALVVGGFLVFSVVSLAVAQRTPALALLGVLGLDAAGRRRLVWGECALLGALAGLLGVALGTGLAAAALHWLAGDLGSGVFGASAPTLRWSPAAAAVAWAAGVVAALAGGAWPAARAARLAPAQALKGLGGWDEAPPPWWPGAALLAVAGGLALLPPWGELPLAAYASVACALVGGIALLPALVRGLLGQRGARPARHALWLLGLQRARHARATATAALAGIVASLALCVALTVMVASFRGSVGSWLDAVLPADMYLRLGGGGAASAEALWPPGFDTQAAALPGVTRAVGARSRGMDWGAGLPAVWLLARPLGERPEQALPLVGLALPAELAAPGEVPVFVSEALPALHGVQPGQHLTLPMRDAQGQPIRVFVRGVWRDFARQFGSVVMERADYQRLTGDSRINELSLWLAPEAAPAAVEAALKDALRRAGGEPAAVSAVTVAQLKAISLQIFDRSFAVTRYLQGVAIAIGLAGVAASLSAQVLARRREFGLLAHLGLTRAQVLRLVVLEMAGWLGAGLLMGLGLGVAISAVLVFVVNPQSFHWTMDLVLPPGPVAALLGAVALAGLGTSAWVARRAVNADAVRAVREDW
ncbi:FtsX-like permease family protein [Ideonella sp. 4Y16]|uniref:FtsX-like permease family protein n=1 Tax=Ideonella alba TaxID=2824118 RepID=UPI001B37DEA0|nr:FtsX-like permease family protein [Ideonella alba]MBQ0943904.1 FtsX-like permease family protein [Ideonella alba]